MRLFSRFSDASRPEHAALSSVLMAGLTLVEPRSLSRGGRLAYRAALAGYMTWTTWAEMRRNPMLDVVSQGALAVGAGGVTLGVAEVGESFDAKVVDGLAARGIARPRVALAVGAGVMTFGTWWLSRNDAPLSMADLDEDLDHVTLTEVPAAAAALAARMLSATEEWGAPALRAQLPRAQAVDYSFVDPEDCWPVVNFHVPGDEALPLAVPVEARFPIVARWADQYGRVLEVVLRVNDGRLAMLDLDVVADEDAQDSPDGEVMEDQPLPQWPDAAEVTLWIDSPTGPVPVS